MNCIKVVTLAFILMLSLYVNADKPNLVLLPIDVSQQDLDLEGQYGSALQEGLQKRYTVFYGATVEKELEKEYSKIDCDAETCNQNIAISFNGELIADSEIKKIAGGYLLKLVIRNVLTSEVIETKTVACENCNQFSVVRELKIMGGGDAFSQVKVDTLPRSKVVGEVRENKDKEDLAIKAKNKLKSLF